MPTALKKAECKATLWEVETPNYWPQFLESEVHLDSTSYLPVVF